MRRVLIVGGSDAGISAALRARELAPDTLVTVVAADAYPNFSICGLPYYLSGEVADWHSLAHRTLTELEATGMELRLDTVADRIDPDRRRLHVTGRDGTAAAIDFDVLIVGTGALPIRPKIDGLAGPGALGPDDGVHLLHSMEDAFAVMRTLEQQMPRRAVIVGAGYIGIEMAEALTTRGLAVTQIEQLPEVLPTVDPALGSLVRAELVRHGVEVVTGTAVKRIRRSREDSSHLAVEATTTAGKQLVHPTDLVLVVVGVRPDSDLAASAGASIGAKGAIAVDRRMRTDLPYVYAAGDCVVTHHQLLGDSYLPLGTTAHKQGRIAGENAVGGRREFAGSLGTQVVKVFDQAAARTGLRDQEASAAGYDPLTIAAVSDDHKRYYPGAHPIHLRYTGDRATGRLLGLQLFGHRHAEVAKRIDIAATAIHHGLTVDEISDLDLSYTPPLGSPWDAVQLAAQEWVAAAVPSSSPSARLA
jgi:NADPH-dependent 2,4-dienoyl-CoA reductase/sulfur reductase-like enzyme